MSARIPLLVPDLPTVDALLPRLQQLGANRWASNFGPMVQELEAKLSGRLGANVVTVANATLGLEIALASLRLEPGSYVAAPALTFPASATAIVRAGHLPYFVDVDPESWCIATNGNSFPGGEVSALMPVSAFGSGSAVLWGTAERHPVVVDAAPAWGNQRAEGGCLTVYSMHATKGFVSGEGGFIATRGPVDELRALTNFGIGTALAGTNGKLSEYHAAVALASLDTWDERSLRRRSAHDFYAALLWDAIPGLGWQAWRSAWTRTIFPVLLPRGAQVDQVMASLAAQGVESRRWYHPLVCDMLAFVQYPREPLPVSRSISDRLIGLPFFTDISEAQMVRVARALKAALT